MLLDASAIAILIPERFRKTAVSNLNSRTYRPRRNPSRRSENRTETGKNPRIGTIYLIFPKFPTLAVDTTTAVSPAASIDLVCDSTEGFSQRHITMTRKILNCWPRLALLLSVLALPTLVGCQTNIAGQTLPSAYYLRDDIQYFEKGPEFKLYRQAQALEEYKAEQAGANVGSTSY